LVGVLRQICFLCLFDENIIIATTLFIKPLIHLEFKSSSVAKMPLLFLKLKKTLPIYQQK
jgi:hypothetical protein